MGSIYGSNPLAAQKLLVAVFIFAIGAVSGGVASGFGYLSQFYYAEASRHKIHREHPYVIDKDPEFSTLYSKGDFWRRMAVISVVVAFFCYARRNLRCLARSKIDGKLGAAFIA